MHAAYLWLIPVLPLIGAVIAGGLALAGSRTAHGPNKAFVALVTVLMPLLAFAVTCVGAGQLAHVPRLEGATAPALVQDLWTWFQFGTFRLDFSLLFDGLSSMMLLFITGIGTLICLYSVGYMWEDRGFARFMTYLNLFLFSMVMLVLGGSLPVTFLGWEGVGLCSYLLVGFWHHNTEYNDAARKAFGAALLVRQNLSHLSADQVSGHRAPRMPFGHHITSPCGLRRFIHRLVHRVFKRVIHRPAHVSCCP